MGIFSFLKKSDINLEVERFKNTEGAVLLDVRGEEEYKSGHIPGSINIPEREIQRVESVIPDHDTPVFIYCLAGTRSWNAANKMKTYGYTNVKNIGGINSYTGIKVT